MPTPMVNALPSLPLHPPYPPLPTRTVYPPLPIRPSTSPPITAISIILAWQLNPSPDQWLSTASCLTLLSDICIIIITKPIFNPSPNKEAEAAAVGGIPFELPPSNQPPPTSPFSTQTFTHSPFPPPPPSIFSPTVVTDSRTPLSAGAATIPFEPIHPTQPPTASAPSLPSQTSQVHHRLPPTPQQTFSSNAMPPPQQGRQQQHPREVQELWMQGIRNNSIPFRFNTTLSSSNSNSSDQIAEAPHSQAAPSLLERRWSRHMARLLEMEMDITTNTNTTGKQPGPSWKGNGDPPQRQRMLPSPPLTESTPEEDRMGGPHSASPITRGETIPFGTPRMNMDFKDIPFLDQATHSLRSHPSSAARAPLGLTRPRSSEMPGRVSLISPSPSLSFAAEERGAPAPQFSPLSSRFSSSFFDGSTLPLPSSSATGSASFALGVGSESISRSISPPSPADAMAFHHQQEEEEPGYHREF